MLNVLLQKILVGLAAIVVAAALGFAVGAAHVKKEWKADAVAQAKALAEANLRAEKASARVVTEYVDRVRVIREKGQTIVKEVPVYVNQESDANCVIPRGFIRVHDGAAANQPPGAADASDALPSGVALSTVAEVVADNYGTYNEVAEQLRKLQQWVREQYGAEAGPHE